MKTINRKPAVNDITDAIEQGYAGIDAARTQSLSGLLKIREIKARAFQREADAAKKLGDTAAAAQSAVQSQSNDHFVMLLKREMTLAKTTPPAPHKGAVLVHGYVWQTRQALPQPAGKARVVLFTVAGREPGRKLAEARTTRQGYFKLSVPLPAAGKSADQAASATILQARLTVLDGAGKEASAPKFIPLLSSAVYLRELFLTEAAASSKRAAKTNR
jgi:hypothetical protein